MWWWWRRRRRRKKKEVDGKGAGRGRDESTAFLSSCLNYYLPISFEFQ